MNTPKRRTRARYFAAMLGLLSLAVGLILGGSPAQPARADSGLGVANWWQHLTGEKTLWLMPEGLTLDYVTSQLGTYQTNGYQIVNVTSMVKGGPLSIYGGFAGNDYKAIDPRVGTLQDWDELLTAAHARGMAVITWFNPSYWWTGSALFKQAEADVRTYGPVRANQPANSPARFFQWQTGAGSATKPCDTCGTDYYSPRWVTDPDATYNGTTISYKSSWSDQPSGDFASAEWRAAVADYIKFWLDTGLDGFIFDAPYTYTNCDAYCAKVNVLDIVKTYPNRLAGTETGRNSSAVTQYGSHSTSDFSFWNYGAASTAIANQNPSGIETALAVRDGIDSAGGVDYNAPRLQNSTAAANLLEVATIATSGNYLVIWDPGTGFGKTDSWLGEGPDFAKITTAVKNNPVLQARGSREKVPTNNDNAYYSFVRTTPDGLEKAVVVLNYTNSAATITTTVSGQGVANGSTTDLLNGGAGPSVSGGQITVSLPARGYAFFKVPVATCVSNLCGNSVGTATLTDLSAAGTSDWTHWGTSSATSIDRKSGANLITGMTRVGTSSTGQYGSSNRGYSWTGGAPTTTATNNRSGIYTTGTGNGYTFSVPAGTTTQTLKVYVGAYQAQGTLTATLSDGSAAAFVDKSTRDSAETADRTITLSFRANSPGQTLTVSYVMGQAYTSNANVTLQSAALAGPSAPVSTDVDDASSSWVYGGGWWGYSDAPAYAGTAHGGSTAGGYGTLSFTGSRVDLYVWKESGAGTVEVFVDGVSQGTRSQDNGGAEAYNQLLYSAVWPTSGAHTIKVVATDSNWTMVDYARVFN